jgi:hypothetical protein
MSEEERNKRKTLLNSYYTVNNEANGDMLHQTNRNPLDINSAGFDSDLYLSQHIKVEFFFLTLRNIV